MKTFSLSLILAFITWASCAQGNTARIYQVSNPSKSENETPPPQDGPIQLIIDSTTAYYQKTVKVDSNITLSMIYVHALQFFAGKNFQQNYGYEQEGKMIYTTTQDLNINSIYIGDDQDAVDPYTVQFSIALDMKNRRYRYTISNVLIFRVTDYGIRRLTLYDVYQKATNTDSKRVAKDAGKVIASFERYLSTLTAELYRSIEQKSVIFNPKF
jgi:hypothetical protein